MRETEKRRKQEQTNQHEYMKRLNPCTHIVLKNREENQSKNKNKRTNIAQLTADDTFYLFVHCSLLTIFEIRMNQN